MLICSIIKPPHVYLSKYIIRDFHKRQIPVLSVRSIVYTRQCIDVLYDHMDDTARKLIVERYQERVGLALLLECTDINECLEVVGRESNPSKCHPGSLRHKYGSHTTPDECGSWQWFENAIHRPIDERERLRDIKLLFGQSD
jgi:nucleoside diphosphate kinase